MRNWVYCRTKQSFHQGLIVERFYTFTIPLVRFINTRLCHDLRVTKWYATEEASPRFAAQRVYQQFSGKHTSVWNCSSPPGLRSSLRRLMATSVPSASRPLYTFPNPPRPRIFLLLKLSDATWSSLKEKRFSWPKCTSGSSSAVTTEDIF